MEKPHPRPMGSGMRKNWIKENNIELEWLDDLGVYYGESSNENGVQSVWMEEEKSLGLKVDLINEYDLAGAACWKLGFEDRSIWGNRVSGKIETVNS